MVVLGIGSNISEKKDPLFFIRKAVESLYYLSKSKVLSILTVSPLYESDALLPKNAPRKWNQPFFNLCVLCQTNLSPMELLHLIKNIEFSLGRKKKKNDGPPEKLISTSLQCRE